MKKWLINVVLPVIAILLLAPLLANCGPAQPKDKTPIVMGYVGASSIPIIKACADAQKIAIDEVNASGGILGRQVEQVVIDAKAQPNLCVDGVARLLTEKHALSINVIPMSDLTLVSMDKASKLFAEYPHIFFADASDEAITNPIMTDYEKNKFVFRNQIMMPASGFLMDDVLGMSRDMIKARKIAILWEDSSYTKGWREGVASLGIPKMSDYAKSKFGLEVVLEKNLQWRSGMYMPVLELCKMNGAEAILYNCGPSSDLDTFTKQWAQSSARDITPIYWWGGLQHSKAFWKLTGGLALGAIGVYADHDVPITNRTVPFNEKCRSNGTLIALTTATAYEDVFLVKAAVEKVGSTKDINAVIRELEGRTVIEGVSGNKCYFTGEKISPFFHSREIVEPKNPMKHIPNSYTVAFVQWQQDGNVAYVAPQSDLPKWASYDNYKKPADLRAAAGVK